MRPDTRNFLTFVKTTAIACHQNLEALAHFLPICNSGRFYKRQKITSSVIAGSGGGGYLLKRIKKRIPKHSKEASKAPLSDRRDEISLSLAELKRVAAPPPPHLGNLPVVQNKQTLVSKKKALKHNPPTSRTPTARTSTLHPILSPSSSHLSSAYPSIIFPPLEYRTIPVYKRTNLKKW